MRLLELSDFFVCHLHLSLIIHFICENHDFDVTTRVLFDFIQPNRDGEEAFFVSEVEDDDDAISSLVVGISNRAVPFLTCSVPNLQLDGALIDLECSEAEVNSNCADVVLLEAIVLLSNTFKVKPKR